MATWFPYRSLERAKMALLHIWIGMNFRKKMFTVINGFLNFTEIYVSKNIFKIGSLESSIRLMEQSVCGMCFLVLKYLLLIFHVSNISKVQNHMVDKLIIEDSDSVCEIKLV